MTVTAEEIEHSMLRFIVDELLEERYDGRDPLATEALDSLSLEQLIEYVKDEFGVALADEDLVRENFADISTLAALVAARQRSTRA